MPGHLRRRSILGRPGIRIVIGVLVAFDPRQAICRKHLVRLLFFKLGDLGRTSRGAMKTKAEHMLPSSKPASVFSRPLHRRATAR